MSRQRLIWAIPTLGLLIPLFIYIYSTSAIRYVADDFCDINVARQYGVLGSVSYEYLNGTGRFVNILTSFATMVAGLQVATVLTAFMLIVWWLALFGIIHRIARQMQWPAIPVAAIGASLLCLSTLNSAFNLFQSVYWIPGSFLYFAPLMLAAVYVWLIVQQPFPTARRGIGLALCAVVPFAAAGFLESFGLLQSFALFLACLVCWRDQRLRPYLPGLLAALIAGSIAAAITVVAPGNFVRLARSGKADLVFEAAGTLLSPGTVVYVTAKFWPLALLALVLLPAWYAYYWAPAINIRRSIHLLTIPLVFAAFVGVYFSLSFFATASPPPERGWIIAQFLLCAGLMLWGFTAGQVLRARRTQRNTVPLLVEWAAFGLMVWFIVASVSTAADVSGKLTAHASAWDSRDQQLRLYANTSTRLRVAPIPNVLGVEDLSTDNSSWVNGCMATYYRVGGILSDPQLVDAVQPEP